MAPNHQRERRPSKRPSRAASTHLDRQRLEDALKAYADECFAKRTALRVKELAQILGISRQHLSREFRRILGSSPRELFLQAQLAEAARLLATSSKTTGEVAVASGFGTQRTLYRAFVARREMTPDEYRNQVTKCQSN
jgi:AraC-like DNA-binding protein